jgi:concanavalin A-like lectin/glucanase superfamily protein
MALLPVFRAVTTTVTAAVLVFSPVVFTPPAVAAAPARSVPDEVAGEVAATAAARESGKSVRVADLTDETTEVRAEPDGSFTWTQHQRPVRVKQAGQWADVDTTLVKRPDGTVGPKVAAIDLTLSGGGSATALVKVAEEGTEVGLGWPSALPEPRLSGSTATYPEVFPGVDLRVVAEVEGFSQLLVVKTPEAARNPELKKITFDTRVGGPEVRMTPNGLQVGDAPQTVFKGTASRMWDSSGAVTERDRVEGTAEGVRTATMGVGLTGSALAIEPDQGFLASPDTKYPVYLDPEYGCTSCGKAHHVVVQSGAFSDAHNYDRTDDKLSDLKAGWVCDGGCFISRTYLEMSTGGLAGRIIKSAYLHVDVISSYECGNATPTNLFWANGINPDTTWANQPGWGQWLSSGNVTNNAGHCPGGSGMDLEAATAVKEAARIGAGAVTFALAGDHEGDTTSWRRFDLNPSLVVRYNSLPNPPADLGIQGWGPNAGDALPCRIGANRSFVATRTPRLRARVSDPDGAILDAAFRVLRGTADNYTWDQTETYVGNVPSGSFAEVTVPAGKIPTDGIYTWHLWSGDYEVSSWSPNCEMEVDTVAPGTPAVSSPDYPAGQDAGGVGKGGSFQFASPTGTSDIAYYLYSFTVQGGDDPQTRVNPAQLNGPVSVSWTPTVSGPQTLSVRSVDRAGNQSAINRYPIDVSDYQVGVSGKVARWSFEDSLADTSGAKSLTYAGPPPPGGFFGPGQEGRGAVMDAQIKETYQAKDALLRTDNSFTVSAWAKLASVDQDAVVLSQDGTHQSGFKVLYDRAAGKWSFELPDKDSADNTVVRRAVASQAPALGEWTHLTGVYDAAAKKLRIYVNGVLGGEAAQTTAPWNAAGLFVIGASKTTTARAQHFTGTVDTVRVHQRALTAAEIAALAAGTATAGPDVEYRFEDNLVNSGANTDLSSGAAVGYADGYAGKALKMDQASGQRPVSTGPVVLTAGGFSAGAWVKLADKAGTYAVLSQDGNRKSGFVVKYSPAVDRWTFSVAVADDDAEQYQTATGTSSPQTGVWTHVAVVRDVNAQKISLYVNGVREVQAGATSFVNATGSFVVGAAKRLGTREGFFVGSVDEVSVYDGALKDDEVAKLANTPVERDRYLLGETGGTTAADSAGAQPGSLYGSGVTWGQAGGKQSANFVGTYVEHAGTIAGTGPLGRWSFDNGPQDTSGNSRDLVHRNASGATPGIYDTGRIVNTIKLNGTDQWLDRAAVLDTSKSFSVSAWTKLNRKDSGTGATVVSQDGEQNSAFLLHYSRAADRWAFGVVTTDTATSSSTKALSRLSPKVDAWTHLLGVYDATAGKARLYVNGYLEGEVPVASVFKASGSFALGRAKSGANRVDFLPGALDEVRAYDRVLGAADALGLWDLGSDVTAPLHPFLRADRSFTVGAWVRPTDYGVGARTAVSFGTTGVYSPMLLSYRPEWKRWGLFVNTTADSAPSERWIISDDEAATYVNSNGWVHLAVSYDAPNRRFRFYVNGIAQTTYPKDATTFVKYDPAVAAPLYAGVNTAIVEPGRDLLIGRSTFLGINTDPWKGAVRDVRTFTGVLPEACDDTSVTCVSQLLNQ